MGIFDLFKKKGTPTEAEPQPNPIAERYLGDLNKTNQIFNLVKTPQSERDENWQNLFLANLAEASFRCGDPQVITGPDGLPYFQLFLPLPNQSFQCYVIDKMKDDFLLEKGYGVVINPSPTYADWVLTYGDILNYHLNQTFYTSEQTAFSKEIRDEVLQESENVMVGQPSETLLPTQTRKVLSSFLQANGIETPKVLLMMRHTKDGTNVSQDLVFNVLPSNFATETDFRQVMQTLAWYLPRHYSFVGMAEKSSGGDFMPL